METLTLESDYARSPINNRLSLKGFNEDQIQFGQRLDGSVYTKIRTISTVFQRPRLPYELIEQIIWHSLETEYTNANRCQRSELDIEGPSSCLKPTSDPCPLSRLAMIPEYDSYLQQLLNFRAATRATRTAASILMRRHYVRASENHEILNDTCTSAEQAYFAIKPVYESQCWDCAPLNDFWQRLSNAYHDREAAMDMHFRAKVFVSFLAKLVVRLDRPGFMEEGQRVFLDAARA